MFEVKNEEQIQLEYWFNLRKMIMLNYFFSEEYSKWIVSKEYIWENQDK